MRLVTGSSDNKVIEWNISEGNVVTHEIGNHSDWVRDVAWAPNVGLKHEMVASVSESDKDSIKIWTKKPDGWENTEISIGVPAWRVGFSPAGNILTVTTSENKTLLYKQALGSEEWALDKTLDN